MKKIERNKKCKFSQRVKQLRQEFNMSQQDLASVFGCDRATICKWEVMGKEPCYETLIEIANYFGVTCDYLLGASDF